jgi:hypothetical protein
MTFSRSVLASVFVFLTVCLGEVGDGFKAWGRLE